MTSLNSTGTTKRRRGTIDKGQISRPKLLPFGSGYGLVDGVDDPFIADQDESSSAGAQLTAFDPRSRGHKRSHTAPTVGSPTTECDIRRSNTVLGRLRPRNDDAQVLARRQKSTTTTNELIEERASDLTLRIPEIAFDKRELILRIRGELLAYIFL
jgi:hypothetical protein